MIEKIIKNLYDKNLIITDDLPDNMVEEYYKISNSNMENIYQFVLKYYDYFYLKRDYGDGTEKTMLEDHIITEVYDNPGITITDLSKKWHRTTSSVSQTISKFVDLGLIKRIRNKDDGKINNLYVTTKGKHFVKMHKIYDIKDTIKTIKTLLKIVNPEDIEGFLKVLKAYNEILEKEYK